MDIDLEFLRYEPMELTRRELWMHRDDELEKIRANVKLVKKFNREKKQLIIKFR